MKLLCPKFHQILHFLQMCNSITCMWPHDADVGKFLFVFRKVNCSFTILNAIVIQMTLLCVIYEYWYDITTIMKALSGFACVMDLLCNLFICQLKSTRIQHILKEMKNFLLVCNDDERIILQKYIDRYAFLFMSILICHFLAIIIFCYIPMFTLEKLPSEGIYPFSTESSFVKSIIYATQVYIIVQCGLSIGVDFLFAVFFLYSSARLEMLCLEIQTAKNERQINTSIKKHQEIIKFVDKTKDVVQFSLFKINFVMAVIVICSTFPIIQKQSLRISFQFIFLVIAGCLRLYITAWPADDLMENVINVNLNKFMFFIYFIKFIIDHVYIIFYIKYKRHCSEWIAMEIYNTSWMERSQCFTKNICFMMQRSQKPLIISMGSILPPLSLKYYAKYLMTLLSYFTTMKAVMVYFGEINKLEIIE